MKPTKPKATKKGQEAPKEPPMTRSSLKSRESELAAHMKLIIMLCVVAGLVAVGVAFHKKQEEKPLGYEYFKKRGYDKIPELEPAAPEPKDEIEDAKIKAQRNIFLQD